LLLKTYGKPIYRLRPVMKTNSYGSVSEDWTTPARFRLRGAHAQDVNATEVEGIERRLVRGEKFLFVPGRADLNDNDRVEVEGEVWRVEAPPTFREGFASGIFTTATLVRISS
jgi:hypothetical protein